MVRNQFKRMSYFVATFTLHVLKLNIIKIKGCVVIILILICSVKRDSFVLKMNRYSYIWGICLRKVNDLLEIIND